VNRREKKARLISLYHIWRLRMETRRLAATETGQRMDGGRPPVYLQSTTRSTAPSAIAAVSPTLLAPSSPARRTAILTNTHPNPVRVKRTRIIAHVGRRRYARKSCECVIQATGRDCSAITTAVKKKKRSKCRVEAGKGFILYKLQHF